MFPHEQIGLRFGVSAQHDPPGVTVRQRAEEDEAALVAKMLATLRQQVQDGAADGIACPCCGRLVRAYRRALNADMARFLILLCRAYLAGPAGAWVDVRGIPVRGGDYAKLSHWGLAEQAPNDDPTKRSSGQWRPTPRGLRFAAGETREASHVFLLDNRETGFEVSTVDVYEALGKHFDFEELWGRSKT